MISLLFNLLTISSAEYRAYELVVKNSAGAEKTLISTLDDMQFVTYYPLNTGESIFLQDTWMCFGRTHDKPICSKPDRTPATIRPTP